jgi:Na+-driven multidrug efflux pump
MLFSLLSLCIVRIPLAITLSRTAMGTQGIWLAVALSYAVTAAMSMIYYLMGKWIKGRAGSMGTAPSAACEM